MARQEQQQQHQQAPVPASPPPEAAAADAAANCHGVSPSGAVVLRGLSSPKNRVLERDK